jgi:glycosyltransferase involved in cell wall biosynthesis
MSKWINDYLNGDTQSALQELLPRQGTAYGIQNSIEKLLCNYLDSLAFSSLIDASIANDTLQRHIIDKKSYTQMLLRLREELPLLQYSALELDVSMQFDMDTYKKQRRLLSPQVHASFRQVLRSEARGTAIKAELQEKLLSSIPKEQEKIFRKQMQHACNVTAFKNKHENLWRFIEKEQGSLTRPFLPFSYIENDLNVSIPLKESHFPVIMLEAIDRDWADILSPLAGTSALFVFINSNSLMQCLQFDGISKALNEGKQSILVLDASFEGQVDLPVINQDINCMQFPPELSTLKKHIENCLKVPGKENFASLYHTAQVLERERRGKQLGTSRAFALYNTEESKRWYDKHKNHHLHCHTPEYMKTALRPFQVGTKRRLLSDKFPLKLAHIVPQIIDEGHAPTKILRNLLKFHNTELFDPCIFSTERLLFRSMEYPFNPHYSLHSSQRGKETLCLFEREKIPCFLDQGNMNFTQSSQVLTKQVDEANIDIAIFHGPDIINQLTASQSTVPFKICFEHGTMPPFPGFDLLITSTESSRDLFKEHYQTAPYVEALPFAVDVKEGWKENAYPKTEFGVCEDAQILTTISNNLEARLNNVMCGAIEEILLRHPNAYYMPIGDVENKEAILSRFNDQNVRKRVQFLGKHPSPSQLARSMSLFLNEFPFGSCIGMLDAMAAGCPVVSMHDPEGPPQARYAASYFGIEYVVTSQNPKDYVELASQLLTNEKMYAKWSEQAVKQYALRADTKAYTKKLEELIMCTLEKQVCIKK